MEQLTSSKAPCSSTLAFQGLGSFANPTTFLVRCVKKKGHLSKHRVEGPIRFTSTSGLVYTIERSIEWEESTS